MRRLEPVLWTKGTLLNPQHLQSQDRFLESSLQFQLQALQFRPWGFRHLRISQEALATGSFVVSEASGIFPDGLLFDMPRSDAAPPARSIAEFLDQTREHVDVYLTVPQYREGGLNIGHARRDAETRYRADMEMVRDENTGQSEKPVMVARKNFRLLVGDENRDGSSALRIARISKTAANLFQLDPLVVPPLLDFGANDYLLSLARRLLEILSAKSNELSGSRRHKNQSLADFTASDIPRFWLLYTTNTALPGLRHLFETRRGHPEALFSAMLSLAGSLSTFSTTIQPRDFPIYNHDDLGSCFTKLDVQVRTLLETVVPDNYVSLPLKGVQPSIYSTSLDEEKYLANTRMYLALAADLSQPELITRAPQVIKLCSADSIDHLVQRALPGVPLTHVSTPPAAIPVKLNFQYFALNQSGGPWETIVRARNLAAWIPGDIPNPRAELIIVLPRND
ncbi:MAG TPA: type VI secretion system baseplate subunit TssK [Bryobacteraceae bacterium]|nr:type VI secretion system baseplate subunit TssK [Bryobacteraceae bacterium]